MRVEAADEYELNALARCLGFDVQWTWMTRSDGARRVVFDRPATALLAFVEPHGEGHRGVVIGHRYRCQVDGGTVADTAARLREAVVARWPLGRWVAASMATEAVA
jgi:hypothetical protein